MNPSVHENATFNEMHSKMNEQSRSPNNTGTHGVVNGETDTRRYDDKCYFSVYCGSCWSEYRPDLLEVVMERVGGSTAVPMTLRPEGNFIKRAEAESN